MKQAAVSPLVSEMAITLFAVERALRRCRRQARPGSSAMHPVREDNADLVPQDRNDQGSRCRRQKQIATVIEEFKKS